MKLTVMKNKANGQLSINIPKSLAEHYDINEKTEIILEPRSRDELALKIKR